MSISQTQTPTMCHTGQCICDCDCVLSCRVEWWEFCCDLKDTWNVAGGGSIRKSWNAFVCVLQGEANTHLFSLKFSQRSQHVCLLLEQHHHLYLSVFPVLAIALHSVPERPPPSLESDTAEPYRTSCNMSALVLFFLLLIWASRSFGVDGETIKATFAVAKETVDRGTVVNAFTAPQVTSTTTRATVCLPQLLDFHVALLHFPLVALLHLLPSHLSVDIYISMAGLELCQHSCFSPETQEIHHLLCTQGRSVFVAWNQHGQLGRC